MITGIQNVALFGSLRVNCTFRESSMAQKVLYLWLLWNLLIAPVFAAYRGPDGKIFALELDSKVARPGVHKRDGSADNPWSEIYGSYSVHIHVGSNNQLINALLDSGSADFWVNEAITGPTSTPFFVNESSTNSLLDAEFLFAYADGSMSGHYSTDRVIFEGAVLENHVVGLVNQPSAGNAVIGLGPVANEMSNNNNFSYYRNLPLALMENGYIKRNMFSVYVDDKTTGQGKCLIGGVDHAKYNGTLLMTPVTNNRSYMVDLIDLRCNGTKVMLPNRSYDVLVDTGTTFTILPFSAVSKIALYYNATLDLNTALYFTNMDPLGAPDVAFNISGIELTVPPEELLLPTSKVVPGSKWKWVLGLQPQLFPPYILGNTFLRSVYTVFDNDGWQIGMAPASFQKNKSLKEACVDGIPGSQLAPKINSTRATPLAAVPLGPL